MEFEDEQVGYLLKIVSSGNVWSWGEGEGGSIYAPNSAPMHM